MIFDLDFEWRAWKTVDLEFSHSEAYIMRELMKKKGAVELAGIFRDM